MLQNMSDRLLTTQLASTKKKLENSVGEENKKVFQDYLNQLNAEAERRSKPKAGA